MALSCSLIVHGVMAANTVQTEVPQCCSVVRLTVAHDVQGKMVITSSWGVARTVGMPVSAHRTATDPHKSSGMVHARHPPRINRSKQATQKA